MEKDMLKVNQKNQPSPDNVLSNEEKNRVDLIVPANSAMQIVIKHSLKMEPTLEELQELFAGSDGKWIKC